MSTVVFRAVDLETSGLEPPEEVIEVGWCDIHFDTDTRATSVTAPMSLLFSTSRPITPENRAVHHITDAMLAGRPPATADALRMALLASGAPFAFVAANAAFEQQWLTEDVTGLARWLCTVKTAARLYPDAESHSNQAIRYRLGLELPDDLAMPPHRAGPDAYVTGCILADFLKSTPVRDMLQWTREPKFLPRCPLGKWKGTAWPDVEFSYLEWILRTPDMDADVKHAARLEVDRRRAAA